MNEIFLLNPTSENVGVQITNSSNLEFVNLGPEGAVVDEPDGTTAKICLAPKEENTDPAVSEGTITLEGKFVVQVRDEVIPYYFGADQLPHFFNGTRPECFGIKFDKKGDMYFTTAAGALSYQGNVGDTITLEDGTIFPITSTDVTEYQVTAGTHKLDIIDESVSSISLAGSCLREVHSFPELTLVHHVKFYTNVGSPNLLVVPDSLPSNITSLNSMFRGATKFNGDISGWDITAVTDTASMFYSATNFNRNLNSWNTANVTNMSFMFSGSRFNQDISTWNVSNVETMVSMFNGAVVFNQNISSWVTSKVTNMANMFTSAKVFNQPIGNWDVSSVTNMTSMFLLASNFNANISGWNTKLVSNMNFMLESALAFNQDLSQWCTPLIASLPLDFAKNAPLFTSDKLPVWGTCPRGENLV